MLGLIILLAIAYSCARGLDNAIGEVSAKHKKRITKASKKNGRKTGAKLAAWTATGATACGTFCKGFWQGWKREWPKAKKRAATKVGRYPIEWSVGDDIGTDGAPKTVDPKPEPAKKTTAPEPARPAAADPRPLFLIKNDNSRPDTTGAPMALATIPEINGVNTLKQAVARTASEAGVTAEEASALAQRAQEEMAAITAMIEQASALEFGDDNGTLQELAAIRDMCNAALAAAQQLQQAMVDKAAIAAKSSQNIHSRHGGIQEAVAAQGGRMASKQAYTADV
ncbi:hypothetical protein ACJ6WE_09040 [Streptomyces sp. MMS24-I31]|uniref:hypothetical protein n=1 Tax=Streptomyces sp. MMS24-I31 TaxID=3351563 RepID=UPI003896C689